MTAVNNIEYRNFNLARNFPFSDDRNLVDTAGRELPVNYFIDASLFPINIETQLYLKSLNGADVEIGSDGAVIMSGQLLNGIVDLYDQYERHVGMLVAGGGVTSLGVYEFEDNAVGFNPSVVFPQTYGCVRGFILPEGDILTGDVTFLGEGGIFVTSVEEDGHKVIKFDAVGMPAEIPDCINLGPAVRCIKFQQVGGNHPLRITRDGNKILISTSYELDDICARIKGDYPKADGPAGPGDTPEDELPMRGNVCPPPGPPTPLPPADDYGDDFKCPAPEEHLGNYYILSLNTGLAVEAVEEERGPVFVTDNSGDIVELDNKSAQGVKLSLRGV